MFDRFWANEDQVFDSWLATWRVVLSRFKDNPGVRGFEPMNEPQGFSTGGQSLDRQKVYPAYRKFAALKRVVKAARSRLAERSTKACRTGAARSACVFDRA